jgi:predicted oxidoreductase
MVGTPEQKRHGIVDTPELALNDWLRFGEFGRDAAGERWPRLWAEAYVNDSRADIYEWLKGHGIKFLPMPQWVERGVYGNGNSVPRWHITWGTGQRLAERLIEVLRADPGRGRLILQFGHRVDALTDASGRVNGCHGVIEETGEEFTARGDHIIVATGGINGSIARVKANWHAEWRTPPETILNGSHKYADGRLHDAVARAGGAVTHLDRMWNYAGGVHHWRPRKPAHGLSLVPPRSALWLNWRGERIGPNPLVSGFDTRDLVTQVCRQERQYSWQLFNRAIALKELAVSGAEFNPSIRERSVLGFLRDTLFGNRWLVDQLLANCIDVVAARTLDELVAKMNALQGDESVDLALVRDTATRYDAEIARGPNLHNDEQLRRIAHLRNWRGDRLRTCKFQPILAPEAGPLIAIREFIVSRKSLGGIQTDLGSRVLTSAGTPIPGLHAVGEAAGFGGGGMNGLRALEGTFLGGCIHGARRAAKAILG